MFKPIVPFGGLQGWNFLNRTLAAQEEIFAKQPNLLRDVDYFLENISNIETAEQLVGDRRLLRVTLGAFGLSDDLDNKFFIRKVLEDGTASPDALANRLSDRRYRRLSNAIGFGSVAGGNLAKPDFADQIISRFQRNQFENAIGEVDISFRAALSFSNGLREIVNSNKSNNARWFAIMGDPPIREVVQTALGLPKSIAKIDLDQQLEAFKTKSKAAFGTDVVADILNPDVTETVIRRYLVRNASDQSSNFSSASTALALLQAI